MATDSVEKTTLTAARGAVGTSAKRPLVLVAGSGRSGTSLFTGILQRLGFHVPPPEVPADDTNPRGFAESQWVVDFHSRLLKRAGVQMSDARPAAWAQTADVVLDNATRQELKSWLGKQFRENENIIIKDPRLSWFLPLWRRVAEDVGASPRFVTVLRHPASVLQSKKRSYGGWQGDIGRAAGWINQTLFTERATRDAPRVFVLHEDLLADWTHTVARVAEQLDLALIREVPASSIVRVHEFVDRTLVQSRAGWGDFEIPASLRERADGVWELVSELAALGGDLPAPLLERLEAARASYIELYEEAEAVAQSSIVAAHHPGPARKRQQTSGILGVIDRVFPRRFRQKLPLRWRRTVLRALQRSGAIGR